MVTIRVTKRDTKVPKGPKATTQKAVPTGIRAAKGVANITKLKATKLGGWLTFRKITEFVLAGILFFSGNVIVFKLNSLRW